MNLAEKRIEELGITLQSVNRTGKGMLLIRQHENLLYTSGVGPMNNEGKPIWTGKLGSDLTTEQGYQAARDCGLLLLARLKDHLGSLDRVDAIVKALGFVASEANFYEQPQVMHGFSDLMVDVFGERGLHARSAIGTNVLPGNISVEIELIVRIRQ